MSEIKVGNYIYLYTLTDKTLRIKCIDYTFRGASIVGTAFAPIQDWREVAQKALDNYHKDDTALIYKLGEEDRLEDAGGFEKQFRLVRVETGQP